MFSVGNPFMWLSVLHVTVVILVKVVLQSFIDSTLATGLLFEAAVLILALLPNMKLTTLVM